MRYVLIGVGVIVGLEVLVIALKKWQQSQQPQPSTARTFGCDICSDCPNGLCTIPD